MLKIKLIGIGAAGNKAAITAFEKGVVAEDELLLINSNLGDIPQEYKKIRRSPVRKGCRYRQRA